MRSQFSVLPFPSHSSETNQPDGSGVQPKPGVLDVPPRAFVAGRRVDEEAAFSRERRGFALTVADGSKVQIDAAA